MYVISATLTSHNDVLLYDAGRISPCVTIRSLPDEVLLDIFEFCLLDPLYQVRTWPKLVHVCQRWRYIVFASPLRLDLCLFCTYWTPVRKTLDVWPPFPIEIMYIYVDPRVEDNIIAALEHPNRVCNILLERIMIPLERLVAVMQEPFPELESLSLQIEGIVPALPNTFLGGFTPRLRSLDLTCIPFPTLPQLLLSSNDLVNLRLSKIPHCGYISPETIATCISALTSLTSLSIGFKSPASRPHPTNRRPPPLTRVVLPALTNFDFHGVSEYLEDLMAQIEAPLLDVMKITFSNQLVFDIQQLPRFIGHAPALMSYDRASITIDANYVAMTFSSRPTRRFQASVRDVLIFKISCRGVDWQISSLAQICNQLSELFIISSIEHLSIYEGFGTRGMVSSTLQDVMDETQWLELFHPFTTVRTLNISISQTMHSHVVSALRGLSGEFAMQVLPALEKL
jgi:F-box-like